MTSPIDRLVQQAETAEREGRGDEARALYERALFSLKRKDDARVIASLMRAIARTYANDDEQDAALDCLEFARTVGALSNNTAEVAHSVGEQASLIQQTGDFDRAEALYLEARSHALNAGETRLAGVVAKNLGVIAATRGDHEKALRYHRTSLAEFRTLGAPKEVLSALSDMGTLCTELERWDDAARAFDEAAQIADALGDIPARVNLDVSRAGLEIARGDFRAARTACEVAMSLSAQTTDGVARGEIERQLGRIARELGEFAAAEEHLSHAEQIALDRADTLLEAETSWERAELHRAQGRYRDALIHFSRGHRLFATLSGSSGAGGAGAEIDRLQSRLERQFVETAREWMSSIESKDRYAQGNAERVADLVCALALRAGVEARELFWFRMGATLHDVGKLVIPSEILNKPGKLAPNEWELVKRHPVAGAEMLAEMNFPPAIIPMVRSHHERWDGQGYPDELAGQDIPRSARILCIADIWDALTSKRSYKGLLAPEAALQIMRSEVGKQFDPELFSLFEDLVQTRSLSARRGLIDAKRPERDAPAVRDLKVTGPSDDLTGLLTRRPFVDIANTILGERGPFATMSLVVIDVDEFKQVNDRYGHLQGDTVLRVVAGTLRELGASTGIIGRYAGDEFIMLLPYTGPDEAGELADRIRATVRRAAVPLRQQSGSISVTLSIGVAGVRPEHRDFDALFAAADRAMYEAKRRGRDAVVLSTEVEEASHEPTLNLKHFVGRDDETRRLVRVLEQSLEIGPRVVCVVGEAGIGKSTLVRRLAGEVRARSGCLVAGQASEADAKPPFAPWAEALDALDQFAVVPPREWRELGRLVPALARPGMEPTGNKYALLEEIAAYVRTAASLHPVVLLLDDMQWADTGTWDALEHLLSQLTHEQIVLCVTVRTEDLRGETLERRNRLLRDERFSEIALGRLSEADVRQWLAGVFGGETSPELLAYLHAHSEGNPLLATQIVRMILDEGGVRYEHGRWGLRPEYERGLPAAVRGLMDRRLERLSAETRRVLSTASVIGRTFDADVAVAAGAGTEDEVLDAIDEAISHGVVEASSKAKDTPFKFTHGLLVDAVRRSINPRRLSRIHEKVAQALETLVPDRAAEIAIHYDRAGIPARAYDHAIVAGREAMRSYLHDEARGFFEIAERAAGSPDERARALHGLAELAELEGRHALTEELCDRALASLEPGRDDRLVLRLKRMRERTRTSRGQTSRETIAVCQELLGKARELGDSSEAAALLNMIAMGHERLGEWDASEAAARESLAAARESKESRRLAESLVRLGRAIMERETGEAAVLYQQALGLFRQDGDRRGEARCQIGIGNIHQRAGELAEAEAAFNLGLECAERARASDLAGLAALNLGVLNLARGQTDLASTRYGEALDRFTSASNESYRLMTLFNMAHLARESEDWGAASVLYEQVMAVASRVGQPDMELGARAGQALAALALGQRSFAEDAMRWVRANVETRPEWWFQGRDLVDALRIRLAAERGDDTHAIRLLDDAVELAERFNPYVAAYLVLECAPSLRRHSNDTLIAIVDRVSPAAVRLGFTVIAQRLAALRADLPGSNAAA
ncbi:MAG TPA: HD domain-containing phosphohydrolase [Gemmatimonadaceae bacterium]|jgi:diguanylate cyclase (GGDEF)-like protein|nr:HD domain-containing phosphohydrolase [Gemmatimonadaceae bacterium]